MREKLDTVHVARRLPWSADRADIQLAGAAALLAGLEHTRAAALRWYHFDPPALLLGSSQQPRVIDATASMQAGLSVYRRSSGGGVVLGDKTLLMLDLVLPREHPLYLDNVTESYRWLGEAWVEALRKLGLPASTIPIAEARADSQTLAGPLRHVCFGGLSPYEAVVAWRKVVGLAQIRRKAGALFQCGIHLRWEPRQTAVLMAASASERLALTEQLSARVAGLTELLEQPVDFAQVMASFEDALAQIVGITTVDADWNAVEQDVRSADLDRYAAIAL